MIALAASLLLSFSAYAQDAVAPKLPFTDWSKITQGAFSTSGGPSGMCDADKNEKQIADWWIERADGTWRLLGAMITDESDRWVIARMDTFEMKPEWIYQGITKGNEIILETAEPYDKERHMFACPLIFRK